jgi:hypothetical protein
MCVEEDGRVHSMHQAGCSTYVKKEMRILE